MNKKIILGIVAGVLVVGAVGFIIMSKNNKQENIMNTETKLPDPDSVVIINENNKNMNTIDPQAQTLINQHNELAKKLSDAGRKGDPTDEDMEIFSQLSVTSKELMKYDTGKIQAILSAYSYGYDLTIILNGKDIGVNNGIDGGGSSNFRLFNSDSLMAEISTPDVVAQNFVLNKGENTIVIKYKKTSNKPEDTLKVSISSYADNDVVLSVEAKNKIEGTIEKTFTLELTKPTDFKTISVEE